MIRFGKLLVASTALVAATSGVAQAAVRYDFTAFSSFGFGTPVEQYSGGFSYTAPTFINPAPTGFAGQISIPAASLTSCSVTGSLGTSTVCGPQGFMRELSPGTVNVSFGLSNPNFTGGIFYYFDSAAFTTAGTYNTVLFGTDQAGRLVVTDLNANAVPEPASWAMLITGFGLAGFALRTKRRRVTFTTA